MWEEPLYYKQFNHIRSSKRLRNKKKRLSNYIQKGNRNVIACVVLSITVLFFISVSVIYQFPSSDCTLAKFRDNSYYLLKTFDNTNTSKSDTSICWKLSTIRQIDDLDYEEVEKNITIFGEVFEGYNLFILQQINRTDSTKRNKLLLIVNMDGEVMIQRKLDETAPSHVEFINSTTLLFGNQSNLVFWNIYNNKTITLDIFGHHEYEYNPINETVFTFKDYSIEINGSYYLFDFIYEHNTTGHIVWALDTRSFISRSQWCPYQDREGNQADVTHSNSIFFDVEEDIIYCNVRNVNTFYKIDHKTGQVLWGLGEYGNFTLFNKQGIQISNLFYHAHAVEKVDDDTFILFDNDYHNQTNHENQLSRILEIKINETTMTANESWSWVAQRPIIVLIGETQIDYQMEIV